MKTSTSIRKPDRRWIIVLALAMAIFASACSSSTDTLAAPELASIDEPDDAIAPTDDDDEPEDGEAPEEVDPEQAFAEFEACMAEYGVSVSFGDTGGAAVEELQPESEPDQEFSLEDIEAAQEECDPILESAFGSFDLSPEQEAEQADSMLELQQCMADAGFDIDMQGGAFEVPQDVDFDEFNAVMNDCAPAGAVSFGS